MRIVTPTEIRTVAWEGGLAPPAVARDARRAAAMPPNDDDQEINPVTTLPPHGRHAAEFIRRHSSPPAC